MSKTSNHSTIGLYYPFINFRDVNWVKMALLYWDRVGRIVPPSYTPRHDGVMEQLRRETDFIVDVDPTSSASHVAHGFGEFVQAYPVQLRKKYGLRHAHKWKINAVTLERAPQDADPRYAHVHLGKFEGMFRDVLIDQGLAKIGEGRDGMWLGMHPRLADVYMTSLAASVAAEHRYSPLADDVSRYLAVGDYSFERLADVLLNLDLNLPSRAGEQVAQALALLAVESVLPANLSEISLGAVIAFRNTHRQQLTRFQDWVHGLASEIPQEVLEQSSRSRVDEYLRYLHEKRIKPELDAFRGQLKDLCRETLVNSISIKLPLGVSTTSLPAIFGLAASIPIAIGGGVALGLATHVVQQQSAARKLEEQPAAYLFQTSEAMNPTTRLKGLRKAIRKFALRV